jgi:hypothetical protein
MTAPSHLRLHLQGGIGDCIKVISCNFALRSLYEKHLTVTTVSYGGAGYNDCGWDGLLKKEICEPCPYLNHSDPASNTEFLSVEAFFQEFGKKLHLDKFLPLNLSLSPINLPKGERHIGIQLSSNDPRKCLEFEKWQQVVVGTLKKHKYSHIYLFDAPTNKSKVDHFVREICGAYPQDAIRLHNTVGAPLSRSINLISALDLMVSSDSFSKYICLCAGIPAVLLCADIGFMSPSDLLRTCFLKEIVYNDKFTLLGVNYAKNFEVKNMVKHINEISPYEILEAI